MKLSILAAAASTLLASSLLAAPAADAATTRTTSVHGCSSAEGNDGVYKVTYTLLGASGDHKVARIDRVGAHTYDKHQLRMTGIFAEKLRFSKDASKAKDSSGRTYWSISVAPGKVSYTGSTVSLRYRLTWLDTGWIVDNYCEGSLKIKG